MTLCGAYHMVPTARFVSRIGDPQTSAPEPDDHEHPLWPHPPTHKCRKLICRPEWSPIGYWNSTRCPSHWASNSVRGFTRTPSAVRAEFFEAPPAARPFSARASRRRRPPASSRPCRRRCAKRGRSPHPDEHGFGGAAVVHRASGTAFRRRSGTNQTLQAPPIPALR